LFREAPAVKHRRHTHSNCLLFRHAGLPEKQAGRPFRADRLRGRGESILKKRTNSDNWSGFLSFCPVPYAKRIRIDDSLFFGVTGVAAGKLPSR
jgi:hypothetical protein